MVMLQGQSYCFKIWLILDRGIGKEVTLEEYNAYREELKVFKTWFSDNMFSQDSDTMSEAIMIMPYGSANPKYRDVANELVH